MKKNFSLLVLKTTFGIKTFDYNSFESSFYQNCRIPSMEQFEKSKMTKMVIFGKETPNQSFKINPLGCTWWLIIVFSTKTQKSEIEEMKDKKFFSSKDIHSEQWQWKTKYRKTSNLNGQVTWNSETWETKFLRNLTLIVSIYRVFKTNLIRKKQFILFNKSESF